VPETKAAEWNEATILLRLKEIAQEGLNMTPEQLGTVDRDSPLIEALRLDSLAQVVLVTQVEADFGCVFEPEEWQQLQTVDDLVRMIAARVREEPGA
jgi:acyl carrier protein